MQRLALHANLHFCSRFWTNRDKVAHYCDIRVSYEMRIVRWIRLMRAAEYAMKTRLFTPAEWQDIV